MCNFVQNKVFFCDIQVVHKGNVCYHDFIKNLLNEEGIYIMMNLLEEFFGTIAGWLWGNWMLYVLLFLGAFYTIMTGGIQFRALGHLFRWLTHKEKRQKETSGEGILSSIQAMYTAIASCVGSGNIVGVATALVSGGAGTLFWMWVAAFVGMATKYAEIVLGISYRKKNEAGEYQGGPMYYIAQAFHAPWLGVAAAILLFCQNAGGTLIQSNTISSVVSRVFYVPQWITGIVLACTIVFIIKGGLKRLAAVAEKIVPIMAGLYVIGGILVILFNIDQLSAVFQMIFSQAFTLKAGAGAAAGITIKEAMRYGVARGLYSNEAGEGSAAVLHSCARVDHPSRQGMFGIVEVFIDTMVICSTTGITILISGVDLAGANPTTLAASAFATVFPAFGYVVSVSLILFATTSIMSQWYFGHVSLMYLNSTKGASFYKYLFPVLILIGSLSAVDLVWSIQDVMLGLLIIPNVLALIYFAPKVRKLTNEFFAKEKDH